MLLSRHPEVLCDWINRNGFLRTGNGSPVWAVMRSRVAVRPNQRFNLTPAKASVSLQGPAQVNRTSLAAQNGGRPVDGLDLSGFTEPIPLGNLVGSRCRALPVTCGVYVIIRDSTQPPVFLERSPAGWFKGQDPSYPLDVVTANWVNDSRVMYIGKAAGQEGLRQRVRQLLDFGSGKAVGHRGGRMLWHLTDHGDLELCWREYPCEKVRKVETNMIAAFRRIHHMRPFANMRD